jgi:putative ABC transport system permease protein
MFWLNVRQALQGLTANKLRSALTMLGIVIGVGAVIALVSLGAGANAAIAEQFSALGGNKITIMPSQQFVKVSGVGAAGMFAIARPASQLSNDDLVALQTLGNSIDQMAPAYDNQANVVAGGATASASIRGITPAYLKIGQLKLGTGRFIRQEDLDRQARVAVISAGLAKALFVDRGQPALGSSIRIHRQVYEVVGILEAPQGSLFAFSWGDLTAYLPLNTAQIKLGGAGTRSLT